MPVSPEFLRTRAKLAEFDNLISTLKRMRLEAERDCTHEQIVQATEHYYCIACQDCVGDHMDICPDYYEGRKIIERLNGDQVWMTYEQFTGRVAIPEDDERIVKIQRDMAGRLPDRDCILCGGWGLSGKNEKCVCVRHTWKCDDDCCPPIEQAEHFHKPGEECNDWCRTCGGPKSECGVQ